MKIISVKEIDCDIIEVKLEAVKRRKIWLKILRSGVFPCEAGVCPLYRVCTFLPSPLPKYKDLSKFCNNLFNNYPELPIILKEKFEITSINQVMLIEKKRE